MEELGVSGHLPAGLLARLRLRTDIVLVLLIVGVAAGLVPLELDRDDLASPLWLAIFRGVARVIPCSVNLLPGSINVEARWPVATLAEDEARDEIVGGDGLCLYHEKAR